MKVQTVHESQVWEVPAVYARHHNTTSTEDIQYADAQAYLLRDLQVNIISGLYMHIPFPETMTPNGKIRRFKTQSLLR